MPLKTDIFSMKFLGGKIKQRCILPENEDFTFYKVSNFPSFSKCFQCKKSRMKGALGGGGGSRHIAILRNLTVYEKVRKLVGTLSRPGVFDKNFEK